MNTKKEPYLVKGKKDKNYAWCSCAESSNQPFCDGSHAKTDKLPIVFKAEKMEICIYVVANNQQMHHIVMVHT